MDELRVGALFTAVFYSTHFVPLHLPALQVLVDHLFQPLALMKYACHLQMLGAEVAPQFSRRCSRETRPTPQRFPSSLLKSFFVRDGETCEQTHDVAILN